MLEPVKKINLTDSIIRQLISYIQTDLDPGEKLPSERQLIDMLGVGRTSLRESLRALGVLGFVETRAGEGTYVTQSQGDYLKKPIELGVFSNSRSIKEIYEARRAIETGMVPVVIANITDEELNQCRAVLKKMEEAGNKDFILFLHYDQQFHRIIAASTKNGILGEVLKLTHRILEEEGRGNKLSDEDISKSIDLHLDIIKALEKRDEKGALDAVNSHMDWTKTLINITQTE